MNQDCTEITVTNGASVKTGNLAIVDTENVRRRNARKAGGCLRVTTGVSKNKGEENITIKRRHFEGIGNFFKIISLLNESMIAEEEC